MPRADLAERVLVVRCLGRLRELGFESCDAVPSEPRSALPAHILGTVALPSLRLDPFAPFLRNIAVVAATIALLASEP